MPSSSARWMTVARPLRFVLVGILNTVFGYGAYAFLLWIGLHYSLAALIGTVAGVAFNFVTTGRLVFDDRQHRALPRFVGVYGFLYLINVAGLAALAGAGFNAYLAGLLLVLPMACLSYLLMRRFVFRGAHAAD